MARFRAYTSDSSDEEESTQNDYISDSDNEDQTSARKRAGRHEQEEEHDAHDGLTSGDESSSSSSSSVSSSSWRGKKAHHTRQRRSHMRDELEGEDREDRTAVAVRVTSPTSPPPAGHPVDPAIIPWAQQIGVDAQKMHVMQTSLFRMPEEAAALRALNQPQPARPAVRMPIQSLNRKHSRDSEGDGLRGEPRERPSFAHDIEPASYRPFRKYARVETSSSVVAGYEGSFIDAGLALGRSFRAGWGPGGTLVHLGTICGPHSSPETTANSSTITKSTVPLFPSETHQNTSAALSEKLLQHHLSHTPITPDDAGIPLAYPSLYPATPLPSNAQPSLNFASFASLFPTTDNSSAAHLFRLGSALFDPIDLKLPESSSLDTTDITPDVRNRIALLRRKAALSKWLKDAVKAEVESDLQAQSQLSASSSTQLPSTTTRQISRPEPYKASDEAFTYLTGHQVKKACGVALDAGYLKLATLISQAGGDDTFRADMQAQLRIWQDEKVMPLIERGVKKVYTLLAGLLESPKNNNGKDSDVDVCSGLDWKRVFGLCLWYGEPVTASIADVFDSYESLLKSSSGKAARPFPSWYDLQKAKKSSQTPSFLPWSTSIHPRPCDPEDPLYALIRLHADPTLSLSHILNPTSFGFGSSRADWSMCWHMYIILSRVMRVRDFGDREELHSRARSRPKMVNGVLTEEEGGDEDEDGMEGHSPSADLLASSYALQLEAQGMIQEAAFVLLHIEGSVGREKAIKDFLARSAAKIDEWMTRGLVGSLKIPLSWVNEAKALHALYSGDIYNAYELYLSAALYDPAHDIAVRELAPNAVIRRDLDLLKEILERFEGKEGKIDGWSIRGKILLDYVHIMGRLPALQEAVEQEQTSVADASLAQELDELTRRIPKIISLLPDVLDRAQSTDPRHAAALEQMVKDLTGLAGSTKPLMLSQIQQSTLVGADQATKLGLIRSAGLARFLKNLEIEVYS
ncbi:hypothetical protein AX17_004643 [Amanita inopinata Kibby_2008]|nr:hypothetical protein AX17_004643 [Amanita inopinata Kibby_2008]